MEVTELLEKVKNQEMTVEEAREQRRELPYEDMGFATPTIIGGCVPGSGK